ncbi:hypothetical protein [Bradyrhizobium iriomotense]|uniref:AbrB family transcriptional regulator n=1 Tax=Bradyrhizobium iriomotense TaxID=441950 RepID=A0ABQ6B819_9BRAD|nr:hypothetical protein [Bradyrhizobium iriomotense]GLR90011.1 hypothetical protein GCM10007857_67250 [Bradyrhizobium iriomotense]
MHDAGPVAQKQTIGRPRLRIHRKRGHRATISLPEIDRRFDESAQTFDQNLARPAFFDSR